MRIRYFYTWTGILRVKTMFEREAHSFLLRILEEVNNFKR